MKIVGICFESMRERGCHSNENVALVSQEAMAGERSFIV